MPSAAYVATPATQRVLDEVVPFLEAPPLEPDQAETYGLPRVSREAASLFEHARARDRARAAATARTGCRSMGSGDWNDGMNRVGDDGRGESVWLGWFLVDVLNDFAPLCERRT